MSSLTETPVLPVAPVPVAVTAATLVIPPELLAASPVPGLVVAVLLDMAAVVALEPAPDPPVPVVTVLDVVMPWLTPCPAGSPGCSSGLEHAASKAQSAQPVDSTAGPTGRGRKRNISG